MPTLKQLRRYAAGELSPNEQHQVEKLALENKHIDDTLEGLQALNTAKIDQKAVLEELRQRVGRRVEKKGRKLFPFYYSSAAAVVVAVGLGWWIIQKEEFQPLTSAKIAPEIEEKAAVIVETPQSQIPINQAPNIKSVNPSPKRQQKIQRPEPLFAVADRATLAAEEAQEMVVSAEATQEIIAPAESQVVAQVIDFAKKADEKPKSENSPQMSARTALMRENSLFNLQKLNLVGTNDSLTPAAPLQDNNRVLNEVTVTNFSIKDREASPKKGWKEYRNYLKVAAKAFVIQNPEVSHVRVFVTFTVNPKGELMDFENRNAAKAVLFDKAVQIIKAGGMWDVSFKNKRPKSDKIRLVIRFE